MKYTSSFRLAQLSTAAQLNVTKKLTSTFWMKCAAMAIGLNATSVVQATPDNTWTVDSTQVQAGPVTIGSNTTVQKTGTGTLVLTYDNHYVAASGVAPVTPESGINPNATIDIVEGTLQAYAAGSATSNSFGGALLQLGGGSTLSAGTGSNSTATITIPNNIQIGDNTNSTVSATVQSGLCIADGVDPSATPLQAPSSPYDIMLAGTLSEPYGSGTLTHNKLVLAGGGKITLSGTNATGGSGAAKPASNSGTGDLSGSIEVQNGVNLCLASTYAIPHDLNRGLILDGNTTLSTSGTNSPVINPNVQIGNTSNGGESVFVKVNSGDTLTINGQLALPASINSSNTMLVNGSGVLTLATANNNSLTNLNMTIASTSTVSVGAASNLPGGTLTLDGGTLKATGALVTMNAPRLDAVSTLLITNDNTVTFSTLTTDNYNLNVNHTGTNAATLICASGGTNAAPITVGNNVNFQVSSATANEIPTSLTLNGGTLTTFASGNTITVPSTQIITLGAQNGNIAVAFGDTLILNTVLAGAYNLNASGDGTLVLGGANTTTGQTLTVTSGVVQFSDPTYLPGKTVGGYANITLAGGTLEALNSSTISNGLTVSADNSKLAVDSNYTLEVGGPLSGNFTLEKIGTGTLTLTENNSTAYTALKISDGTVSVGNANNLSSTGTLTLNGGTLKATGDLTAGGALPNLTVSASGGTLNLDAHTITMGSTIAGTGTLSLTGASGATFINSPNSSTPITVGTNVNFLLQDSGTSGSHALASEMTTGTFTLSGGALTTIGSGTATYIDVAKSIALDEDSFVTVNGTDVLTLTGAFTGAKRITANGAGTLVLGGANTTTGQTLTVTNGVVQFSAANNLPPANIQNNVDSSITLAGGTLEATQDNLTVQNGLNLTFNSTLSTGTHNLTVGGPLSGSYTLEKIGTGTLTLTHDNSGATALKISDGTVSVNAANQLPGGALTLNSGTLHTTAGLSAGNNVTLAADSTISATGTLELSNPVSGTGALAISSGIVKLSASNSNTGTISVSSGATLELASAHAVDGAIVTGSQKYPTLSLVGGSNLTTSVDTSSAAIASPITLTGTVNLTAKAPTALLGALSGSSSPILAITSILNNTVSLTGTNDSDLTAITVTSSGANLATLQVNSKSNLPKGQLTFSGGSTFHVTGSTRISNPIVFG